jgi:signal transduction histidine kinase
MPLINQTSIEKELQKLKSIIQFNSAVNEAILNARTINELFDKICKAIIENTILGISLDKNKSQYRDIVKINWLSITEGYLSSFENHHYFNEHEINEFSLNETIQAPQYFCSNNIETDLRLSQWADIILDKGYKSLFALPIIVEHKLIVVINLYSQELNYFTEDQIDLFLNLRDNIVFCINTINLINSNKDLESQKTQLSKDFIQKSVDSENFAYILSHHIRSHVANILGLNKILLKENTQGKTREYIEHIANTAKNLDEVVKDVSIIMNLRNFLNEEKSSISLETILKEILHEEQSYIHSNLAQIRYLFSDVNVIESFPIVLKSIFKELIINAIKYAKKNETPIIEIKSALNKNLIQIYFKDNGIGIDMERYGLQIFGLYKKFNYIKEGKGTGLYRVKKQIESINGNIEVKSVLAKWTEFVISLPVS